MQDCLRASRIGFQSSDDREATPNNIQGCLTMEQERVFHSCDVNFVIWDGYNFAIVSLPPPLATGDLDTCASVAEMPSRGEPKLVQDS
jgi:hypothetical protein